MEPNARLKRVAGKQTTTLTHYGRKTGKPHEVTIWFVLDDDKLYIGTANVPERWLAVVSVCVCYGRFSYSRIDSIAVRMLA